MIPNNIHFVFFGFTEFAMIHYLAVKTALEVHKPDRVIIHYTNAPQGNPLWDDIAKRVELRYVVPPEQFMGVPLTSYQYKADITRLEILIKEGGIYLDIDVLSLQPFGDLLNKSCVLGVEAADDLDSTDLNQARSITNAVMMCEPNHPFFVDWLQRTGDNLVNKTWAYHAVCLPLEMLKSQQYSNIHVEPCRSFMPFDFRNDWVFRNDEKQYQCLQKSYTMHLWETIWYDGYLKQINNHYLETVDNIFTRLFRTYKWASGEVGESHQTVNLAPSAE